MKLDKGVDLGFGNTIISDLINALTKVSDFPVVLWFLTKARIIKTVLRSVDIHYLH